MEKSFLADAVLISILPDKNSNKGESVKFLSGKVIKDQSKRFKIGSYINAVQIEISDKDTFLTIEGNLFKSSNIPEFIEVSCAEFLLLRMNSLNLDQIIDIRNCSDKNKLILAFDSA